MAAWRHRDLAEARIRPWPTCCWPCRTWMRRDRPGRCPDAHGRGRDLHYSRLLPAYAQDNAFESGAAFDVEFITDETGLRATAIEDFWRTAVAEATSEKGANGCAGNGRRPRRCSRILRPTLALDDLQLLAGGGRGERASVRQELDEVFDAARASFGESAGARSRKF